MHDTFVVVVKETVTLREEMKTKGKRKTTQKLRTEKRHYPFITVDLTRSRKCDDKWCQSASQCLWAQWAKICFLQPCFQFTFFKKVKVQCRKMSKQNKEGVEKSPVLKLCLVWSRCSIQRWLICPSRVIQCSDSTKKTHINNTNKTNLKIKSKH